MHILVTADTLGGVWTYTRELVTGLSARGHRVTLVSFGDIPSMQQAAWITNLENVDYRPTAFRLEWMQDSDSDLFASAEYLRAVIAEVEPDLLHLSQFYYGDLQSDIPRVVVAHSDVVTWWLAVHGKEPPDGAWMRSYRSAVQRAVTGATVLVAPSRWMLNAFQSAHGCPRSGHVIHNGLTPAVFDPNATKKNVGLSVGRVWDLGKNSVLLSRIQSPLPIYLAGNDEPPSGASNVADFRSAESRGLFFTGLQEHAQLRELFANAAIYIATSQYEPFGLAPLEAAFSRCALVASDIPSLREIWGDDAFYFKNNDEAELERVLQEMVSDPALTSAMGDRAYGRAITHYSTLRMVDQYMELYTSLVTQRELVA
jgi:glycogen(starch) synthase